MERLRDQTPQKTLNERREAADADKAYNDAIDKLDKADNARDVVKDLSDAEKAMNDAHKPNTGRLDALKAEYKQKLEAAKNTAEDKVNNDPTLTRSEREEKVRQIEAAYGVENNGIDALTDAQDLQNRIDKAPSFFDAFTTSGEDLASQKAAAKAAVSAKAKELAQDANNQIDADSTLTDAQKALNKAAVETIIDQRLKEIDSEKTADAIVSKRDELTKALEDAAKTGQMDLDKAKAEALTAIENAKNETDANIRDDDALSNDEKTAQYEKAQSAFDTAKAKLTPADGSNATADAINDVLNNGPKAINDAYQAGNLKPKQDAAKQEIDAAVARANNQIDEAVAENKLDTNEAAAQKQAVQDAKAKAYKDIDAAKNSKELKQKTASHVENIDGLFDAKQNAKAAIDQAQKTADADINGNDKLSDGEKAAQTKAIDELAKAEKAKVDVKPTDADATQAGTTGKQAVDDLAAAQKNAYAAIDEAVAKAKQAVSDNSQLGDTEKANQEAAIDGAAKTAKNNINNAADTAGIDAAKTNGVNTINELAPAKTSAYDKIDGAASAAKQAIADAGTVDPAKADQEKAVDDAAKAAKNNVDKAENKPDVEAAAQTGFDNIQGLAAAKKAAYDAIDKAKKEAEDGIDSNAKLDDGQKAAQKQAVENAANTAKGNIDRASDAAGINQAQTNGVDTINGLNGQKDAAYDKIDGAAKDAKNAIAALEANGDLTPDQAKKQEDAVDAAAKTAKNNVDKAENKPDIEKAGQAGFDNLSALTDNKKNAYEAIKQAADAAKNAIDGNSALDGGQKANQKAAVDGAAKTAMGNIDKAENTADVDAAKNTGVETINNLNGQKQDAYDQIKQAADAAKAQINNNEDLDDGQKKAQVAAIDGAAKTATDNVDKAEDKPAIDAAANAGIAGINDLAQNKKDAYAAIKQAADAAKAAIENNNDLDGGQKAAQKTAVDEAAKTATDNVDKAQNKQDVDKASQDGVDTINGLNDQKKDAYDKIDEAAKKAEQAIDDAGTVDPAKTAQKKAIQDAAKAAKDNVDKAHNKAEIDAAANAGIDGINGLAALKKDAYAAIDQAAKDAKAEIANNGKLEAGEKEAQAKAIDNAANNAKADIDKAANKAAIDDATNAGVDNIKNLNGEKNAAYDKINEAAKNATDAIAASDLDGDAKKAQTDAVKNAADAAKTAIDQAVNKPEVDDATDAGLANLNNLAKNKQDAYAAIKQAADAAKAAIDANTQLDGDQKAAQKAAVDGAAKTATKNIDNATNTAGIDEAKNNGVDTINGLNQAKY